MDLVPAAVGGVFEATPGGSPANVAVGLARLGVPTFLVARLSDDALGRRLRAHLEGNGVDLSRAVRAAEPSSLAIVRLDGGGVPDYDFRVDGTADWQWRDEELNGVLDGVAAVHAGSLALVLPPGAAALRRLLLAARLTATVSYDPNVRPALMGSPAAVREWAESLVEIADVVKASVDDMAWLFPGRSPEDIATDWAARGPAVVAITLGHNGVIAAARDTGLLRRPGRPVTVADTVGAGDSFMSGLLAGLHSRGLLGAGERDALTAIPTAALSDVLDEAVLAASITCMRRGAQPPTLDELRAARLPFGPIGTSAR